MLPMNFENMGWILFSFLGCGLLAIAFYLIRRLDRQEDRSNQLHQSFQSQVEEFRRQLTDYLSRNDLLTKGYTQFAGDIQNRLGQLIESTQSIKQIGQDLSGLQDILKVPKLRGILGEFFLEELLGQILPQDRFVLQYRFKTGEKVDAVILLGQGMVPVDSKFPLENFKRKLQATGEEEKRTRKLFLQDVKKHVDDIASKYILPEEGTFDFALMYIPAENVYYETIIKEEGMEDSGLIQYALARKVIPVSPNSFYAYLQAIVLGLRGLRIESSVKEILAGLTQLNLEFGKFYEDFDKLGQHLSHTRTAYDRAQKRIDRFKQRLESIESPEATPYLASE